jgi:hypothetical protein
VAKKCGREQDGNCHAPRDPGEPCRPFCPAPGALHVAVGPARYHVPRVALHHGAPRAPCPPPHQAPRDRRRDASLARPSRPRWFAWQSSRPPARAKRAKQIIGPRAAKIHQARAGWRIAASVRPRCPSARQYPWRDRCSSRRVASSRARSERPSTRTRRIEWRAGSAHAQSSQHTSAVPSVPADAASRLGARGHSQARRGLRSRKPGLHRERRRQGPRAQSELGRHASDSARQGGRCSEGPARLLSRPAIAVREGAAPPLADCVTVRRVEPASFCMARSPSESDPSRSSLQIRRNCSQAAHVDVPVVSRILPGVVSTNRLPGGADLEPAPRSTPALHGLR